MVLGLVTSKTGTLEQKDDIRRRIDEATKYADLDQFCLSPQCGFASTEEGNILAEERSEEHTSELQSLMRISYAVFCLKKKTNKQTKITSNRNITKDKII